MLPIFEWPADGKMELSNPQCPKKVLILNVITLVVP